MRDILAERLLAKVMKWNPEDVAKEMPDLQALATYKYDEYQQFSPGMRFIESLALWLAQFQTDDERKQAYIFVRSRLVFVSAEEMARLIATSYPDIIRPFLIQQVAHKIRLPEYHVTKIVNSPEFVVLRRQSLFLGLSDGARIDLFRRSHPEISHEQIYQTYEISEGRANNMLKKLEEDMGKIPGKKYSKEDNRFRMIFLLDDFSGSGHSYLRPKPEAPSEYEGKIARFFQDIHNTESAMTLLFDPSDIHICIVLYMATTQARKHLETLIDEMFGSDETKCTIRVVHTLQDSIKVNIENDKAFMSLIEKYYDSAIEDEHYLKGRHAKPYLGYDECALPLILSHNCPNNSVPILWFDDNRKFRGLFPRVSRHGGRL
jgi:hypothetical protein